jgi:hypothetical protein
MNPKIWHWLTHNWWGLLYRQHQRLLKCSHNLCTELVTLVKVKVKQSHYRPQQAHRVDTGIALPFCDLGTRKGVWSASHPSCFTPRKDPVPIVQEAGWTSGPVWMCAKTLTHTGIRSSDCPAHSQSLYQLSYPSPPCNTGETEMLVMYEIFMAVKPNFVNFRVMTLGGYKCFREPRCPDLQDSNISNLTLSLLMSYIYVAPNKARNLTSCIYGQVLMGILLLEPYILLICTWKINKYTNYSFNLLIKYGSSYMFRHYIAILREHS